MPIGEVERSLFRLRGRFAHGFMCRTEAENDIALKCFRAYQTLFNRVLLCVIGHSGNYIDYSSFNFPERKIHEPLGGPMSDGRALSF